MEGAVDLYEYSPLYRLECGSCPSAPALLPVFPSCSTNNVVAMPITAGGSVVLIKLELDGLSP
jgi:hypothetical protein